MKLFIEPPNDGRMHTYCFYCGYESPASVIRKERLVYDCPACQKQHTRALIIDPGVRWWLGADKEYWHETAGIFLSDGRGKFLFFERTRHPFGLTVPAGHVDDGESEATTARRELNEEATVLLPADSFTKVATEDIQGDECRRGADVHRWHVFAATLPQGASVRVDQREGVNPVWLRLPDALTAELTFASREVILRRQEEILAAVG